MSNILKRLIEAFSLKKSSGYSYPQAAAVYETPSIPLGDVIKLYERDPTCKASVDLLAASAVGAGFYTTVNERYELAGEAKAVVNQFNEEVNLDALLCDMARVLIACGILLSNFDIEVKTYLCTEFIQPIKNLRRKCVGWMKKA